MAKAVVKAGLVAVGLVWAVLAQTVLADEARSYVKEGSEAAGLKACVEPTPFMRRNHFELIEHQRDATVHQGIRSTKYSLAGCIACHVAKDSAGHPVPVNAPDQFCNACHRYAAVHVNCFDCHSPVPNGSPVNPEALAAHGLGAGTSEGGSGQGGNGQ
jgi:hypothetical protein